MVGWGDEAVNAYWCRLEGRTVGQSYEPPDPGEWYVPCGIFIAETRGQAKRMLVDSDNDIELEEFVDVRVKLLERDTDAPAGQLAETAADVPDGSAYWRLWGRVHEVEYHGGEPCDCPEEPYDD